MKYKILLSLIFLSSFTIAQQKKSTAYAITSEKQGQFIWTEVKLIDLSTGEVIQHVYENSKIPAQAFRARDGKPIHIKDEKGAVKDQQKLPFSTFSAACAFDRKHNRLYFTPMYVNELRYIDLGSKQPKLFYYEGESFSKAAVPTDEANHITRMTIGADGNGYALSNDGNHFIRFTTDKKANSADLGPLRDDPSNEKISVHNRCTSWGGDMVAAADGSLYLVSASKSVFRIDVSNRMAKYIGGIDGLPANFTSNGTAVGSNGKLIVSSANSVDGYYEVDMSSWKANKIDNKGNVFNTSDLANGNLAFQNETKAESIPLVTRPYSAGRAT
ncbi:MAG: hypothetical protein H7Y31_18215, partial [Chitinophagaceae bacterium]|nr:hypothetical protein [Chitinophagaceae bacterium]